MHEGQSGEHDTGVASLTIRPIRWWTVRVFGRTSLARAADRVEAWAVVVAMVVLLVAAYPAWVVGQAGYTARSHAVAAEAASDHPVEATALGNSKSQPTVSESVDTTFVVDVRWFAQNATHDAVAKVDHPVKAGDHVGIWLDHEGNVTTPPLTDADARITAIGTAVLLWLTMAAMVGAAFAVLRKVLDGSRDRGWDRGLRELVGNGGGSASFRS
jgi:hypothetical protein